MSFKNTLLDGDEYQLMKKARVTAMNLLCEESSKASSEDTLRELSEAVS